MAAAVGTGATITAAAGTAVVGTAVVGTEAAGTAVVGTEAAVTGTVEVDTGTEAAVTTADRRSRSTLKLRLLSADAETRLNGTVSNGSRNG
jgi:hypothetical protein